MASQGQRPFTMAAPRGLSIQGLDTSGDKNLLLQGDLVLFQAESIQVEMCFS
jgi:hypothetical protein